ncbi:thioredoxin family protein [Halobacteriaceae archaeon GCM10025711]
MTLQAMEPNPDWDPAANAETVAVLRSLRDEVTYRVWGADWCGDCRYQLPDFAAALDAADVPEERVEQFPVDDEKAGEHTEEYGVEFIPTIVVERDGEEVARFVEREEVPAADYLADRLADLAATV